MQRVSEVRLRTMCVSCSPPVIQLLTHPHDSSHHHQGSSSTRRTHCVDSHRLHVAHIASTVIVYTSHTLRRQPSSTRRTHCVDSHRLHVAHLASTRHFISTSLIVIVEHFHVNRHVIETSNISTSNPSHHCVEHSHVNRHVIDTSNIHTSTVTSSTRQSIIDRHVTMTSPSSQRHFLSNIVSRLSCRRVKHPSSPILSSPTADLSSVT